MLAVNQILQGRYQIISQLGHGGMGAVYQAQDTRLGALVAIKEILVDLDVGSNPKQQELVRLAFEREAKILASLHHEAFPRVTDYFSEQNRQFLVMELIKGEDLVELLEKNKSAFPLEEVLRWAEQLLDALDYLHTRTPPILHRDIKPQNLKLTRRGKIVLLDFGIAKGEESKTHTSITNQTFVAVTLNYSPIEQIFRVLDSTFRNVIESGHGERVGNVSQQTIDARSDLYALGATLYHLMTGQPPIDALKRTLEIWTGNSDILVNPSEVNPKIPPEISTVLLKAMEIDRENRFASAKEMHLAFSKAVAEIRRREEESRQAVMVAEKLRLERERQLQEQQRLQMEEEQKRLTAERLREAEILRQIAEERAREAEKRLLERESQDIRIVSPVVQEPVTPQTPTNISQELTLHDYHPPTNEEIDSAKTEYFESKNDFPAPKTEYLEPKTEYLESANSNNFETPNTEDFKLLQPENFTENFTESKSNNFEVPESQDFTKEEGDSVDKVTRVSYLVGVLPETPKPEPVVETVTTPPIEEEKPAPFNFKLIWLLPVIFLVLLTVFGITLAVVIQIIPGRDNSGGNSGNNTVTPTPVPTTTTTVTPTVEPTITPTVDPSVTPTNQPTPVPTRTNPKDTSGPTPTPVPTRNPTQRPTQAPTKRPTVKPTKNPGDCIFNDNCK